MPDSTPPQFAIGVDYGTGSVRALVVDLRDGRELGTSVCPYPTGEGGVVVDSRDPNLARQNPQDYVDGFLKTVAEAVEEAKKNGDFSPNRVVGIGVDTTGSTPIPVNEKGTPLSMLPEFNGNPAAMAWLWKDHTSHAEAQEISDAIKVKDLPYLAKCGGVYSSEWWWSKLLHCLRTQPEVSKAAAGWVELCDWVPAWACGDTNPKTLARGICAAGHKALYHDDWGGLPPADFLDALEQGLSKWRYDTKAVPSDQKAGTLCEDVAGKIGLPAGIAVAVGAFDAHMGAVGAGAGKGTLVKIMGTSTCDCMPAPMDKDLPDVPGLCGIVPGSIVPGMYGLEAGQSAVGDIFDWFTRTHAGGKSQSELTAEATKLAPGASGLVALDWNNGNRTVLVDPRLTGLLIGQTLHTTAAETYRALIEATAFGALTIINRFEEYGVHVEEVVNCGGIAEKNALVMQIYADVCNRPMKVSRSGQTCALGAAIFGAVAGGTFAKVEEAQATMTGVKEKVYEPNPKAVTVYAELYKVYKTLHDAFGTKDWSGSLFNVMKDLIDIRQKARGEAAPAEALDDVEATEAVHA